MITRKEFMGKKSSKKESQESIVEADNRPIVVRELNNIKMGCCESCKYDRTDIGSYNRPSEWGCAVEDKIPEWTEGHGDCPRWELSAHFCDKHKQWHQGECGHCIQEEINGYEVIVDD